MRLWPRKQVYIDDLPKTHDFRFAVLFVVLFAAVIAAVYAVGYFVAGDRLATGTTVSGVEVGGMDRDEARTLLQEELAPRMQQPITVTGAGDEFELDPQQAGLTLDLEASVEQGLGPSPWDPAHMLEVVTGGEAHEAVVMLDEAEFQSTADAIAAEVERPAADAKVSLGRNPDFDAGVDGVLIDRLAFAKALKGAVLEGDDSLALPLESVEPTITTTEASDFVTDVAEPAVSGDVRVRVGDSVLKVKPAVFAGALRATEESGELQLTAESEVLFARSKELIDALPHRAVNASFAFRDGRPIVVRSRSGATVSPGDWSEAVVAAAQKQGAARRAEAAVTEALPRFSTADARSLEISDRVAVAAVRTPGRLDDDELQRSARLLAGAVIRPGATLSLTERLSGQPSAEASVVATGLFDASFRAGLAVVERHAPSVHTVGAPGLDAAIGSGQDLALQNAGPYGVLVRSVLVDGPGRSTQLRVELWSAAYWDVSVDSGAKHDVEPPGVDRRTGSGCQPQGGLPGFSIEVSRTLGADDVGASSETVPSRYQPRDRVVCRR